MPYASQGELGHVWYAQPPGVTGTPLTCNTAQYRNVEYSTVQYSAVQCSAVSVQHSSDAAFLPERAWPLPQKHLLRAARGRDVSPLRDYRCCCSVPMQTLQEMQRTRRWSRMS